MAANEGLARNNFAVMTLVRDAPLDVDPLDLEMGGWHRADVQDLLERLEMKGAWRRVAEMLDSGLLGPGDDGASGVAFTTAMPDRVETQELSVSLATSSSRTKILAACEQGPHVAMLSDDG